MKLDCSCDFCGKQFFRYKSQTKGKRHLFCSRECAHAFETKALNPEGYQKNFEKSRAFLREHAKEFNKSRMTKEVRAKLRESRLGTGRGISYTKLYGRHEHRVVAEQMLGRPLLPGEVVHHIDGNKRNNRPENLMVFKSQAEHAAFHAKEKRGDPHDL